MLLANLLMRGFMFTFKCITMVLVMIVGSAVLCAQKVFQSQID
jgi:hypothetical protein